jgi:NAD(P)H-nitrite reductase large subunit
MKTENFSSERILDAPLTETVCWCSNVNNAEILEAIEQGARNLDDVRHMTGACTVGKCRELSPRGRCCSKEIKLLIEAEEKQL